MRTRILTAAVGIPVVLAVVFVGGYVFKAAVVLIALAATWEAYTLLRGSGHHPAIGPGLAMAGFLAVAPGAIHPLLWWQATTLLGMIAAGVWFLFNATGYDAFTDWALTVVIAFYAGGLAGSLTATRFLSDGLRLAILVLILTWAYDTGAYLTGRTIGRTPFMQNISEKKTLEGVAGGLALTIVVALVAATPANVPVATAFVAAVAIALAAQAGDLIESLMKRYAGVKDSGNLLPGHGGLLDRIDGLLFSGTAAYFIFLLAGYK
ncbi:MAG TPA: phosphatidate cytidylyltransferase [Chloroflexota bacterium]|nr:phosphatidate cytidylyltransferase [Chloroflexota bacterium]